MARMVAGRAEPALTQIRLSTLQGLHERVTHLTLGQTRRLLGGTVAPVGACSSHRNPRRGGRGRVRGPQSQGLLLEPPPSVGHKPAGCRGTKQGSLLCRHRTDRHRCEHSEVGRHWYKDTETQIHPGQASLGTRGVCVCVEQWEVEWRV